MSPFISDLSIESVGGATKQGQITEDSIRRFTVRRSADLSPSDGFIINALSASHAFAVLGGRIWFDLCGGGAVYELAQRARLLARYQRATSFAGWEIFLQSSRGDCPK